MLEIYRGGRRNGHHLPKTLLLHNATLAYQNQNFCDRKLKKSTKTVFVTIYLMIFCGRIIGALSSDWLLPLPPIRQQHNHDQLSQHNLKTQELSTKCSQKNTNTTAQTIPTISTQLHKKNKVQQTCYAQPRQLSQQSDKANHPKTYKKKHHKQNELSLV